MNTHFSYIEIPTDKGISLHNLTSELKSAVKKSEVKHGFVTVTSNHITTGIIGVRVKTTYHNSPKPDQGFFATILAPFL